LVIALVLSRLDYGNVTLAGLPTSLLNYLQSVINAAARSIASLRRSEHITDALASFHWLWAPERMKFKLAVLVYRALHGTAPQYLSGQLQYVTYLLLRRQGRPAALVDLQSPWHPSAMTCYCRRSSVCCCWTATLELSTCRRPVCPITHNISTES